MQPIVVQHLVSSVSVTQIRHITILRCILNERVEHDYAGEISCSLHASISECSRNHNSRIAFTTTLNVNSSIEIEAVVYLKHKLYHLISWTSVHLRIVVKQIRRAQFQTDQVLRHISSFDSTNWHLTQNCLITVHLDIIEFVEFLLLTCLTFVLNRVLIRSLRILKHHVSSLHTAHEWVIFLVVCLFVSADKLVWIILILARCFKRCTPLTTIFRLSLGHELLNEESGLRVHFNTDR